MDLGLFSAPIDSESWSSDRRRRWIEFTASATQASHLTIPRWSPDGRRIVPWRSASRGNVDIYVVDAQGSTPQRMTTDPGNDASADWSRDGKWIYFASNRTGRQEIWKMPADGSAREVQVILTTAAGAAANRSTAGRSTMRNSASAACSAFPWRAAPKNALPM